MNARVKGPCLPAAMVLATLGPWAACTRWSAGNLPSDLTASCTPPGAAPVELALEQALPIDAPVADFEPSGLALLDGRLLTVSDKQDDEIFEIVPGETTAQARPFRAIQRPAGERGILDLEGIAVGQGATLLLVSEERFQVLAVPSAGQARWLIPSVRDAGRSAGLFGVSGAGIEGIAVLSNGDLLLAAERQPRGLIELPGGFGTGRGPHVWVLPPARCAAAAHRPDDLADLAVWAGSIFGLQRNAHLVVRLEQTQAAWVESEVRSYARTENDPRFAYRDRRFGLGEGLAVDDRRLYVVLDNNHDRRAAAPDDRRPLLFIFRNDLRSSMQ